jgi:hypothetical protein
MRIIICLLVICLLSCTQITYIHSNNELVIFRLKNRVVKVDTLKIHGTVYKVYYRDFIF